MQVARAALGPHDSIPDDVQRIATQVAWSFAGSLRAHSSIGVDDLAQEALIAGWRFLQTREHDGTAAGYGRGLLATHMRRRVIDWLRATTHHRPGKTTRPLDVSLEPEELERVAPPIPDAHSPVEDADTLLWAFRSYTGPTWHVDAARMWASGKTLRQVGEHYGVTESRACQVVNQFTRVTRAAAALDAPSAAPRPIRHRPAPVVVVKREPEPERTPISIDPTRARVAGLTQGQMEVLDLLTSGLTAQQMAVHLHLSVDAVKTRTLKLRKAAGASPNLPGAVGWGYRTGVLRLPVENRRLTLPASAREVVILDLLGRGQGQGAVAASLGLSTMTVKSHVSRVSSRWELSGGVTVLVGAAYRAGVLPVNELIPTQ